MILVTLLFACPPVITDDSGDTAADTGDTAADTGDTADTDTGDAHEYTTVVLTTVSDDYASATLATVDLATRAITDSIVTAPTDAGLVYEAGKVFLLGRFGYDLVRVYEPGSWSEPEAEFSVGDGGNPYDVHVCGDKAYVSLYGETHLNVYDPETWVLSGVVDLTTLADSDGVPEIAEMIEQDGTLYVALQQLDEDNFWAANGGMVAAVDCASGTLVESWPTGPSPSLHPRPEFTTGFFVRSGVYYDDVGAPELDGGLSWFDPGNGAGQLLVKESELEENVTDLVMVDGSHGLFITQDAASAFTAWCWDANSLATVELFTTTSYLASALGTGGGEVWIAARRSWTDPESKGGLVIVDALTCAPGTETWIEGFTFAPSAMTMY